MSNGKKLSVRVDNYFKDFKYCNILSNRGTLIVFVTTFRNERAKYYYNNVTGAPYV
jgi:hypothetical protein